MDGGLEKTDDPRRQEKTIFCQSAPSNSTKRSVLSPGIIKDRSTQKAVRIHQNRLDDDTKKTDFRRPGDHGWFPSFRPMALCRQLSLTLPFSSPGCMIMIYDYYNLVKWKFLSNFFSRPIFGLKIFHN